MKVLVFVILLSTLNFIKFAKSLNLTYILKQRHDYYEPNCIAEEDLLESPIGWIYPLPKNKTDIPKTTSRFVPDVANNYSCNFENGNLCSHTWLLSTEKWTLKTDFDLILDTRWEGFPALLTTDKTEKVYYEVTQARFNFGFSVRAPGNVEVLLCEGWNPKSYPCYYINMGDEANKMVYLRKIGSMEDLKKKGEKLDAYKYYTKVLFEDEWRNFEISYALGRITLLEVFTGKMLLNYKDPQPLNLLYVLPRSKRSALWKVHKNQFFYKEDEGITKFGPEIETPSSVLCVSLYASLCENCSMTFSVKDGGEMKDVDKIIGNKSDLKWRHVKLVVENITSDSVQLYVQTTKPEILVNDTIFWAIDDVRICNVKEIKISTLVANKFTSTENEEVSCQSVLHQKWRPTKHVQPSLPVFPGIETFAHNNSIELVWIPNTSIVPSLSYLIHFQGEDICSAKSNKNRLKSSGFVITKDHKTVINNLVPYTHYNIEFSYVLEEQIKNKSENTLPTDVPTDAEVPKNVTIEASEFDAVFYWEKPDCENIYGPLWYLVKVSSVKSYYKELEGAEAQFKFKDLEPFTEYQAEIVVARWRHNFLNDTFARKVFYNFTTTPAVAPAVRNLEAYSVDEHQVALRYDLPYEPRGIPKFVQVSWFDSLMNTRPRANVSEIKSCKLWPEKYCVDLNDLVANRVVQISVSLKNDETHMFGKEKAVKVFTSHDRVPGKPTNITYRVVDCRPDNDYCHLNISWTHPYQQNTTITSFNINLNKTISKKVSSHITELLKIYNGNYQPIYNFQIKYIPYSTRYFLSVQSVHDEFKSDFATIAVKTDDIGDHIDQSPKLKEVTNSTLVFGVSELDPRLNATVLTAIVQDYDENKKLNKTLLGLELHEYNFCNAFGDTWVAKIIQLNKESQNLVVGDGTTKYSPELKRHVVNKPLLPNTKYCLTFIVRNKYEESEHEVVYYEKEITTSEVQNEQLIQPQNTYTHLYILFVVLLLIPAGFVLHRYIQKRKARRKRNQDGEENVYESLPFEECENCVYNNTYDKLMHS